MTTEQVIALAQYRVANPSPHIVCVMKSSAQSCLDRATKCMASDMPDAARRCAVESLKYTVGIFHADYARVIA